MSGELRISGNGSLTDLGGLAAVVSVGALAVVDEVALTTLAGLSSLDAVADRFEVSGCSALATCEAFALVDQPAGDPGSVCIVRNLADTCPDDSSGC